MKSRQGWADLYAFEVTRADDTPLFRQLYQQLCTAILSGTPAAGNEAAIDAGVGLAARRVTFGGGYRL